LRQRGAVLTPIPFLCEDARPWPDSLPLQGHGFRVAERLLMVTSNRSVNDEYRHLCASGLNPETTAEAGQFFHLLCPPTGTDSPFLRRPMSIYGSDADSGTVEFLYKVTGAGTRGLASLREGDRLDVLGPLGVGFNISPSMRHIAVVGRGVGLATLAPLAKAAKELGVKTTALLSARQPDLLMSAERFQECGADVITVTDSERTSDMRNMETLLRHVHLNDPLSGFFTCGSRRITSLLQRLSRVLNIPGQVALEQQMACGLGMCFCCVKSFRVENRTEHRRVCVQGPVFDLAEVLP